MELDRGVDRLLGGLGRQQLRHRRQRGIRPRPSSNAAAAWWTSSRAASTRAREVGEPVGDRLVLGQRLAERLALERVVGRERRAPRCAMPIANAPTLGRNRSSVRIATRKPLAGLAEHVVGGHEDVVEPQRPDRVRGQQLLALAGQALAVARHRERRQPAPRPREVRANTV